MTPDRSARPPELSRCSKNEHRLNEHSSPASAPRRPLLLGARRRRHALVLGERVRPALALAVVRGHGGGIGVARLRDGGRHAHGEDVRLHMLRLQFPISNFQIQIQPTTFFVSQPVR